MPVEAQIFACLRLAEGHKLSQRLGFSPMPTLHPPTRLLATAALAVLLALSPGSALGAQFTDVTVARGVSYLQALVPDTTVQPPGAAFQTTGGAAACDVDRDGWVDLIVTRLDAPPILFRNVGGTFVDATASAGDLATALPTLGNGVGCADLENDGDLDLYITGLGTRFHLFLNDGSGVFTEAAVARGAATDDGNPHYGMGVAFGDYDRDSFLDIFPAEWWAHPLSPLPPLPGTSHNRLLRNLGTANPAHFVDVTLAAELEFETLPGVPTSALGTPGYSPGFVDFDDDGWPDLTWVADWGNSRLFWNDEDGTFTDGTLSAGVGLERAGMGSTQDDFDRDGKLDWLATSIFGREDEIQFGVSNQLYLNRGDRTFQNVTAASGIADGGFSWAASGFDFDNDGDIDVAQTNGLIVPGHPEEIPWQTDQTRLFQNVGYGVFYEVGTAFGITDAGNGKGLLTFDYDRDGDLDVFLTQHAGPPILYENDGGNALPWIQLALEGSVSNRDGIGAVVTIVPDASAPATAQTAHLLANSNYLAQDELLLHFGLGANPGDVDQARIEWPSGIVQWVEDLTAETRTHVVEPAPTLLVEFVSTSATVREGETVSVDVLVGGGDTRLVGPTDVDVVVTAGDATPGVDVDIPATLSIPAGDYTTPVPMTVAVDALEDLTAEPAESLRLELRADDTIASVGDVDGVDRARDTFDLTIEDVTCWTADKSKLTLIRKLGVKDALKWTWRGRGGGYEGAFGEPDATTGYEISVVDASGDLARIDIPPGPAHWRSTKRGYVFKDPTLSVGGLRKVAVLTKHADDSLIVKGRGVGLALATREPVAPVRARLSNSEGVCWEITFADVTSKNGRITARTP